MKWDEIYDRSREVVRRAVGGMLDEESPNQAAIADAMDDIVDRLQDSDYLADELKKRERYDYRKAFRSLKRNERMRGRLRALAIAGCAACAVLAVNLVVSRLDMDAGRTEIAHGMVIPERGMKAVLLKADGEKLQLDERSLRVEGDNGSVIAADSTGLQYETAGEQAEGETVYNTLIVPRGSVYMLTMRDGTKAWLNSGSELVFPVSFTGSVREVVLAGEAFFDVTEDRTKPFIVTTQLGSVKVLGTQFNVKSYREEASVATTLVEGSVSFSNDRIGETRLSPGHQLVYDRGEAEAVVRAVNVDNYVGWLDNRLSFQGETLEEIMRVLSRWYDMDVVFEDQGLKQIVFSGNLDKYEEIGKFFELFELGANVKFEIDDKVIRVHRKK